MSAVAQSNRGEIVFPNATPGTFSEFIEQRDAAVAVLKRIDSSLLRLLKGAPFVFVGAVSAFALAAGLEEIVVGEAAVATWIGVAIATAGLVTCALLWQRIRRDWAPARRALEAWHR